MINRGVIINGLLPNLTTVLAIMDDLYCAFKAVLRKSTRDHYAKKIKANSKVITKRKLEIARKVASGKVVTEVERAKTRSVIGLNPMDLGPSFFCKLTRTDTRIQLYQLQRPSQKRRYWRHTIRYFIDSYYSVLRLLLTFCSVGIRPLE